MTTHDFATLSLLGDSDLTVADGEEDIRGAKQFLVPVSVTNRS